LAGTFDLQELHRSEWGADLIINDMKLSRQGQTYTPIF
jgi:hypothetical protein